MFVTNDLFQTPLFDHHVGNYVECFASFNLANSICRKYCAIRLRCAIEQNEQLSIEHLEDFLAVQTISFRIQ